MDKRTPVLIMIQGEQPGARYVLARDRETCVGRSSQSDISLVNPRVASEHCAIRYLHGTWQIRDLGGDSGTFINEERIEGKVFVNPGDIIRIGTVIFRFERMHIPKSQNEGTVAISEAQLDARARPKQGLRSSLEDIRRRSQLAEAADHPGRGRRSLVVNAVFVGACAVLIFLTGGLLLAHAGASPESTPDVRAALSRMREAQIEKRYGEALAGYETLLEQLSSPRLKALVRKRKEACRKLAQGAFEDVERRAERLVWSGDRAAAIQLYRKAARRFGIDDITRQARDRIERLQAEPPEG